MNALKLYFSLEPAQRRLIRIRQVEGERQAGEWISLFNGLAQYDEAGDELRGNTLLCAILSAVLSVIIGVCFLSMTDGGAAREFGNEHPAVKNACRIAALLLLASTVLAAVFTLYLKRIDVPNQLRELVFPLLRVLQEDMAPETKVQLRVDLRGAELRSKFVRKTKDDPGLLKYPKFKRKFYRDHWLSVKARLADRSTLDINLVADLRVQTATRRRATKVKVKTKRKFTNRIDVRLKVPTATHCPTSTAEIRKSTDAAHIIRHLETKKHTGDTTGLHCNDVMAAIGRLFSNVAPANIDRA